MDLSSPRCPNCAAENDPTDKFCGSCGAQLPSRALPSSPASHLSSRSGPTTGEDYDANQYGRSSPAVVASVARQPSYPSQGGATYRQAGNASVAERAPTYAGFWRRFFAIVIDTLIVLPLAIIGALCLAAVYPAMTFRMGQIVAWLIVVTYYVIGNGRGATFGKMSLGIRVIDADGNPPGLAAALIRSLLPNAASGVQFLLPAIPALALITGLISIVQIVEALWMLWDDRRQALHDKMAGTYVVNA